MKKVLSLMCSLLLIVTLCGCSTKSQSKQKKVTLTLAAAASLENIFEDELIPQFEKENPQIKIQGVYDSSGKLQIQIEQGLKADVFFSAATKQMNALVDEKYIDSKDVINLLENKLVLITGKKTETNVKDFNDLTKASTIAIGDPDVVPAGQYAKMALTHLGVYDQLVSRYSLGGNVTEVLNWVANSSSEVGIVYSTDAKSTNDVKVLATCSNDLLDEPVIYPVSQLSTSKHSKEAKKFVKFIQDKSSLKLFEKYGFTINK
ncbi:MULTISPECIES: molybdate ABC transporter substrate-binding protein [Coprobacillaceae]|uniref:molybdate ABC transporter substrate-binding protein n=1 Tax=Coprobacillaceae TaxID=2810280 RepID=UPI000E554D33|nr:MULTISPECIES: molybdate ABC transporter substrate-binding protein [Coprobacillaceae]RHM63610.1 molybdate ABC transporter substrate-binding protein [Coprobacillus sp. AF33-1AC]RHS96339.1 molybdate ABC transporter substrate-binding protein [Erysipelatoclostridium sp. AM42-17]